MTGDGQSRQSATPADAGFTLLEMVVALALLALLLAAMPGALRLGFRALGAAGDLERDAARQAAMDFIEQRLALTSPIYEHRADGRLRIAFRGERTSVGFVAPAASGPASGLYQFELKGATDAAGHNGVAVNFGHYRQVLDQSQSPVPKSERLLLAETEIAFRYFGATTRPGERQWNDTWGPGDSLPEMIEVAFIPSNGGARRMLLIPMRLRPAP